MSTIDLTNEELLTTKGAAGVLEITHLTFTNKKSLGDFDDLPCYKIPKLKGNRYLKSDIIAWVKSFQTKPKRGRPRKAV